MRICIGIRQKYQSIDDEPQLSALSCDRMIIDDNPFSSALSETVLNQYLRAGDTLCIVSLNRLGASPEQIVRVVARLHESGVNLVVKNDGIDPANDLGKAFPLVCAQLAGVLQTQQTHDGETRRRGRPAALTPEMRVKVQQYLERGDGSVMEIARMLRVSPATIYRYFPGRKHPRGSAQPAKPKDGEAGARGAYTITNRESEK